MPTLLFRLTSSWVMKLHVAVFTWTGSTLAGRDNVWLCHLILTTSLIFSQLSLSHDLKPPAFYLSSCVPAHTSNSTACPVSQKTNICPRCRQQLAGQLVTSSGPVSPSLPVVKLAASHPLELRFVHWIIQSHPLMWAKMYWPFNK